MLDGRVACLEPISGALRILFIHGIPEPQLARELARDGHDVLAVTPDARATRLLGVFEPHVVLVATTDVAQACRELRRQAHDLPIVAIAPDRDLDARIAALESGADDCVSSPFHPAELTARMHAAVRRGALLAAC
ncbi:MAG: response regulator transcription factor [Solirubrobacteraceae bacterium]